MEIREVRIEPGGWVAFDSLGVRVRFHYNAPDLRVEPVGVEFLDGVLTARRLSQVPFGRLEVIANGFAIRDVIAYSTGAREQPGKEAPTLPATMEVTDTGGGKSLDDLYDVLTELGEHKQGFRGRHSEAFYRHIAAIYYRHAVSSDRPGQDIADRLGVPVANVWRWIRECRPPRRNYLPAARAGKI